MGTYSARRLTRMTPFAHLHTRSWFSFRAGGSAPEALVAQAASVGVTHLALTDVNGVYGIVRFQRACAAHAIHGIVGSTLYIHQPNDRPKRRRRASQRDHPPEPDTLYPILLLAQDQAGYARLSTWITQAHLTCREAPHLPLTTLEAVEGLHLVISEAYRWDVSVLSTLKATWGDALSLELTHHYGASDQTNMRTVFRAHQATDIPLLATGNVRYATPRDYRRYDLLTCVRLGIDVFTPHPDRPRNAEQYVCDAAELHDRIPWSPAHDRAVEVATRCAVNVLADRVHPPYSMLCVDEPADHVLRRLCEQALAKRYRIPQTGAVCAQARAQFEKEFAVITSLALEEFFLVVHEIVEESRRRDIRCAGRGSAANAIVSYLLGITAVDPLAHNLLFERFLHGGRKGTPDIDVDFESERRDEIIAWMEERFGHTHTAMTANLVTYQLRSALRDVAKVLGWNLEIIGRLTAAVPRRRASSVADYRSTIEGILGKSPLVDVLIEHVDALAGCPRHLGLHSGGMILSRLPLSSYTPIQRSANGVKVVQFDKDDVEHMGLIKFDVLGLRMLSTLSEATTLIARHQARHIALNELRLDDGPTFDMIRRGETIGVFQIESQGQLHLLAKHQPETFQDLVTEIALFRPGPLQGGMVQPFVRRRQGKEAVVYDHPDLEPVLRDTYGVILFQEQVLDVAHRFAGMSLAEADQFRRLMSKFRDPGEMGEMRGRFVELTRARGISDEIANRVFDQVAGFVGYGFCRSHAAAFARTVYQSAWLKCHQGPAYMAALMQHIPGLYPLMTLEQEARRMGIDVRPPCIHRSGLRYDLERGIDDAWAIRKPLPSIHGVSLDDAKQVVWARLRSPITSIEDLLRRTTLSRDVAQSIARSGALDTLAADGRSALWTVGVVMRRLEQERLRDLPSLFEPPRIWDETELPNLPRLTAVERISWDYQTHHAGRAHPMTLMRRELTDLEIRPIETCYRVGGAAAPMKREPRLTIAGIVMLRQRPPTAKGVQFVTLEDETGFIQCIVYPVLQERLDHIFVRNAMIVRGRLQIEGNWRGFIVEDAWVLDAMFGGYEGYASYSGGRDRWVRKQSQTTPAH